MTEREQQLEAGLGKYLAARWNAAVAISKLSRIPGGASRETWKCEASANGRTQGLIVRIDPETSLIDTDRRTEYKTIEAMFTAGLPVPEPVFLEEDLKWIGRPFSITKEVPGCQSSAEGIPPDHREKLGRQKWTLLGQVAKLDPLKLGMDGFMRVPALDACAREQLDYWHKVIVDDEIHPNPVAHAAVRWLLRNPPPPAQKLSVVHGDFRTGNYLYSPDGEIRAILDWEMAHLGDPYEDLAWSLDPLWNWGHSEYAGRLLPHREAIRVWQQSSGLRFDPRAFRWWQVFASVKGIGIWISSSEDFHKGASKQPILALAGWLMTDRQQQILVDYLSPNSVHRFFEANA